MSLLGISEVVRCHIDTDDRISGTSENCVVNIVPPIQGANWVRIASASLPISSGTFQVPRDPGARIKILRSDGVTKDLAYMTEPVFLNGSSIVFPETSLCGSCQAVLNANGFALNVECATEFGNITRWTNNDLVRSFTFLEDNYIFGVLKGDVIPAGNMWYGHTTMVVDGKNDMQYLSLPDIITDNRVSFNPTRSSTQNIACRVPNNSGRLYGAYANFQNMLNDDWSRIASSGITQVAVQILNRNRQIQSLNGLPGYFVLEFK